MEEQKLKSLDQLPLNVQTHITLRLSTEDIPHFFCTCKTCYSISQDDSAFITWLYREFGAQALRKFISSKWARTWEEGLTLAKVQELLHLTGNSFEDKRAILTYYGIDKGFATVVKALLDVGVDRHIHGERESFLSTACQRGHVALVDMLLSDPGQSILEHPSGYESREDLLQGLLVHAVYGASAAMTELLVQKYGAPTNAMEGAVLVLCSSRGATHLDVARVLLAGGADVHVREETPLITAVQSGHAGMVDLLLDAGADVLARDEEAVRLVGGGGVSQEVRQLVLEAAGRAGQTRGHDARGQHSHRA
mmetsp:Transcript_35125/g.78175  ORF Transcript_35125/g.78175 Transcript_35125/m.78175 type:complete len:308 (-) Transcript_35125:15-938(-)